MNHAEYVFSEAHQVNKKVLRAKCDGLGRLAEFIKRYAEITDLDSLEHFLPQLIEASEDTLSHTQHIKQKLKDAREASE